MDQWLLRRMIEARLLKYDYGGEKETIQEQLGAAYVTEKRR